VPSTLVIERVSDTRLLHFRPSCESLTLRLLRPTARAGKILSSQRRWKRRITDRYDDPFARCRLPRTRRSRPWRGDAQCDDRRSGIPRKGRLFRRTRDDVVSPDRTTSAGWPVELSKGLAILLSISPPADTSRGERAPSA